MEVEANTVMTLKACHQLPFFLVLFSSWLSWFKVKQTLAKKTSTDSNQGVYQTSTLASNVLREGTLVHGKA